MTKKKNFSNQDTPDIIDTEYENCNFAHDEPVLDGNWKGHRLFPGDDTPRTFRHCNLINCEPPPRSIIERCNCAIIRPKVLQSTSDDIVIDGQGIAMNHYKRIVLGKYTENGYLYYPEPKEYEFDEVA